MNDQPAPPSTDTGAITSSLDCLGSEAKSKCHALGVLLVHGIGEQKQGETLDQFATPIIKWIDQWLSEDVEAWRLTIQGKVGVPSKPITGHASFTSGSLRPPDLPLGTPAHAVANIVTERPHAQIQTWLFAESWWTPQTLTPPVSRFLLWLITRGPWVLLGHLNRSFRVDFQELKHRPLGQATGGWLRFMGVTVLWLAISLLLDLTWCLVSLVAFVPIAFVRKGVYDALQTITGVVGDSYVLIADPIQRVTFANTTRQALLWLRNQGCRKVAVMAHSQGAVIARDMLLARGAPPVDLLVTFGPGLDKLDALIDQERVATRVFLMSGAAAPLGLVAVLAFVQLWVHGQTGFVLWLFPVLMVAFCLLAALITWETATKALKDARESLAKQAMEGHQPHMAWRDFYASHDPVSNGSLKTTVASGVHRVVSHLVRVRGSRLDDHTNYWTSTADFVPRVVRALALCAGTGLWTTNVAGKRRLRIARTRFIWSVHLLVLLRWADALAVLLPWWHFTRLRGAAAELRSTVDMLQLPSASAIIQGVERVVRTGASVLVDPISSAKTVTDLLLLGVATGMAMIVWRRMVTYWWQIMAPLGLAPVFRPTDASLASVAQGLSASLVLLFGVVPIALSIAWTFFPTAITWRTLDLILASSATLLILALWVALFVSLCKDSLALLSELRSAGIRHAPLSALRSVSGLRPMLISWILFGVIGLLLWMNLFTIQLLLIGVVLAIAALWWL